MYSVRYPVHKLQHWPPVSAEHLQIEPVGADSYRIVEIPLFARNVAPGDLVKAEGKRESLEFREWGPGGGHALFHVVVHDSTYLAVLAHEFDRDALSVRIDSDSSLLAIDVSDVTVMLSVKEILSAGRTERRLDFEEARLPSTLPTGYAREYRYLGMPDDDPYPEWRRTRIPRVANDHNPVAISVDADLQYADTMLASLVLPLLFQDVRREPPAGFPELLDDLVHRSEALASDARSTDDSPSQRMLQYANLLHRVHDTYMS